MFLVGLGDFKHTNNRLAPLFTLNGKCFNTLSQLTIKDQPETPAGA